MKKLILVLAFLLVGPLTAHAATYYLSATGSDATGDGSTGSRWATFSHAFSEMSGGDTLIVGDGTYNQYLYNPPNGSAGAYTTIIAENNQGVSVSSGWWGNGGCLRLSGRSYVKIEGMKFNGEESTEGGYINGGHHLKIVRCSFHGGTEPDNNNYAFVITGSASYILVEECWAWGTGRYTMAAYQSDHIIFRRCVARFDYCSGYGEAQNANFVRYEAPYTDFQNCIAIDTGYSQIKFYGGIWNENNGGIETPGKDLGCMFVNVGGPSINDYKIKGNRTIENCSFAGSWWVPLVAGSYANLNGNLSAKHLTIHGGWDGGYIEADATVDSMNVCEIRDSIITGCENYGLNNIETSTNNILHNNSGGNYIAVDTITDDILTDPGLLYITRVEDGSAANGTASDGGDIGATILYCYGVNDTLWGEAGYETLTTNPLWPFPNEAEIRSDMRSFNSYGIDGTRGFCANGQTLTKYIWEYLGNTIPANIYNGTAPEAILITTTSLAAGTLNTAYNVSVSADKIANWSLVSGSLPTNTTLINVTSNQSCRISGYPNVTGDFSFTLRANWTTNQSIIDTQAFTVNVAETFTFPTTPILDNFTRINQTPLGSGWIDLADYGQLSVIDNTAGTLNDSQANAVWDTSYGPNSEVYANITTADATQSVIMALRYNPSTLSGYMLIANPAGTVTVKRIDNAYGTVLATYTQANDDGDAVGLRMIGNNLTTAFNNDSAGWVSLGSVTDDTYASAGYLILSMNPSDIRLDDFGGGTYGVVEGTPINIITTSLAAGVNNSYYNQSVNATSTGNWTLASGAYPTNLTLVSATNSAQAFLQGYPNATGLASFVLQVTNATSNDTQSYSVNITAGDTTPPANVTNLAATTGGYAGAINLQWTAPGDDGNTGTASSYVIKYSTGSVNTNATFTAAPSIPNPPTPTAAGTTQTVTVSGLTAATRYYFAIKAWDNEGLASGLSNMANATSGDTPPAPTPGPYGFRIAGN